MTERLDLSASRNATWNPTIEYVYDGEELPLTDATIALQWRLYPGAADPALIDLADVEYEDEELVAATDTTDARRVLRVFPEVSAATLDALPSGLNEPETGEADRFTWDLVITYADAVTERLIAGDIYLEPGVTQ